MSSSSEEQKPGREVVWRRFRDQRERCAGCGTRLKWDEQGVRGRAGAWVVAEEAERAEQAAGAEEAKATFTCICFKCLDHAGPKLAFHLVAE